MLTLSGRVAVITGGSRGIGAAIALRFAKNGMKIAIISSSDNAAESKAKEICNYGYNCIGLQCDVSDQGEVERALDKVNRHFGAIDVIVNCAGVLDMSKIEDLTVETWDRVMAVNLKGTFLMIQQSIPYLSKSKHARIVNIASNSGRMGGYENGMAYSASKGGVIALTYGTARQLAPKGITVNCIAPGTVESDMLLARDEATKSRLISRFPIGRFGTPDEVAAAACYFASEEAAFTTGSVLDVNGGMFMG